MNHTRARIEAQLEAQRWQAQQASREQPAIVAWNAALERAGLLATLPGRRADSARVLDLAKGAR